VVDATNACRIRCTRRDETLRRFFAVGFFLAVLADFLVLELEGFCAGVCASNGVEGSSQTLATRKRPATTASKRRTNFTLNLIAENWRPSL
jgi:hypothetical protein